MSETSTPPATEGPAKPGRYQRSAGGLLGSMVVLVVVVLGIVVFRAAFRATPDYRPEPIDYRALITSVQGVGLTPVYPHRLPDGWSVKDASFTPGQRPVLDLVLSTDDQHTAGLHEEDAAERTLLATYVGTGVSEDRSGSLRTPVATWTRWTDTDTDHAYTAQVDGQTVLVYSSGDPAALTAFVRSLTTEKLRP